mgnify:CR=1 FL=1
MFVALHPGMKDQKSRGTRTLALSGEEIDNRKKSGKEDNSKGKDGMKKQKNKNKQEKEGEKKGVQEAEKSGKDLKTKKKKILLTHGSSSPKEGQSPKTQHIDLILGGYVNRDNEFAEVKRGCPNLLQSFFRWPSVVLHSLCYCAITLFCAIIYNKNLGKQINK